MPQLLGLAKVQQGLGLIEAQFDQDQDKAAALRSLTPLISQLSPQNFRVVEKFLLKLFPDQSGQSTIFQRLRQMTRTPDGKIEYGKFHSDAETKRQLEALVPELISRAETEPFVASYQPSP